jgi:DNA polymerase-4
MQEALAQGAAPMRIPFSTIPDIGLEEDRIPRQKPGRRPGQDSGHELWLQRERQFKVLAEETHRQAQARRKPHRPAGTGGWTPGHREDTARDPGPPQGLF